MKEAAFSWKKFTEVPVIGIIRNVSFEDLKQVLPLYCEAGFTTVEVTMNTPDAVDMIRYALEEYADRLNVGAGTVCSKDELKTALAAGAQFIVTPIVHKKIIRGCVKQGVPVFPGAYSPTEIYNAWRWGAAMVKVYPASVVGPAYIKDVKAPLNQLKLVPTGGITRENLTSFLEAGADGLGVGSEIFNKGYIKEKDWAALKTNFEEFIRVVKNGLLST